MAPGRRTDARQGLFFVLAVAALGVAACSSKGAHVVGSDGGSDGGLDAGPLVCPPAPLDEWTPPAYIHAQAVQHVCTTAMLQDFYTSCLGPMQSATACGLNWGAGEDVAHSVCQACIITPSSGMTLGPLINYGNGSGSGTVSVNVAGCVELLDPSKESCAASVQLADECQHAACDATCPVTDETAFLNWQACTNAASQTSCAADVTAAGCVNAEDAGPAATCLSGADFQSQFLAIAPVFCGSVGD
jgi:hypothetical protein